jgi:hypothetical protein
MVADNMPVADNAPLVVGGVLEVADPPKFLLK